jgi:mannitol-1-phosphate 5-dehydrogenase
MDNPASSTRDGSGGPHVLIVGAGATGRGHVAQLAVESGCTVTFLDKDERLCTFLRTAGEYSVRLVGGRTRTVRIGGFEILHTSDTEGVRSALKNCPLVFTAVCPGNLREAAASLREPFARWLRDAGPGDFKNVLCCENMNHSSTTFRDYLLEGFPGTLLERLERQVGFADTMVARVVAKPADPLSLLGEEYSEWTADRTAFRGPVLPQIKTLELVDDQTRFLQRKLYIHNTGHATFGYLGFLKGHTWIHEAAQDPQIMAVCEKAIEESGWAIEKEYGFTPAVIRAYRAALTEKCVSPELPDEIVRVVREPIRKLGRDERFFGPIRLMLSHGRQPQSLLYGVCAALLSRIPGDEQSAEIGRLVEAKGVSCLNELSGMVVPGEVLSRIDALLPRVREQFSAKK